MRDLNGNSCCRTDGSGMPKPSRARRRRWCTPYVSLRWCCSNFCGRVETSGFLGSIEGRSCDVSEGLDLRLWFGGSLKTSCAAFSAVAGSTVTHSMLGLASTHHRAGSDVLRESENA